MSAPSLFDGIELSDTLADKFWTYHRENPAIYGLFCRFTGEALEAGRDHLGAKMIYERIRWFTSIETDWAEFKLNNNYHAFYARLWMRDHPQHGEFFRTRKQKDPSGIEEVKS